MMTLNDETTALNDASQPEDSNANKKEKARQKRQMANELLAKLSQEYPLIFPKAGEGKTVPLAIGLHKSLLPIMTEWGFNSIALRTAMYNYTRQLRYQRAILFATHRINLDGSLAEEITQEQKIAAKEEIAKIEKWLETHQPEKAQKLAEKKAQFSQKKRPEKTAHTKKNPTKKKSEQPKDSIEIKSKPAEHKSSNSSQSIEEKMQNLLSKFNQH